MGNYTIFYVRKSWERQASKKFYNKCSENSRSQIVFRTDIFRKFTLGAPDELKRGASKTRGRSRGRGRVNAALGLGLVSTLSLTLK